VVIDLVLDLSPSSHVVIDLVLDLSPSLHALICVSLYRGRLRMC
jgi:hypothetical protein